MSSDDACVICRKRPKRQPLPDERGEQCTIGLLTCQECSGQAHAWGCNDPALHDQPAGCSRHSKRERMADPDETKLPSGIIVPRGKDQP